MGNAKEIFCTGNPLKIFEKATRKNRTNVLFYGIEVIEMEERMEPMDEMQEEIAAQEAEVYKPRPGYQVWAARIGLAVVIIAIALYYYHIARGG